MKDQFRALVVAGKFYEACELVKILSDKELEEFLYLLADEHSNLCAYAFACFLLSTDNALRSHKLAYLIIGFAFPYLNGAAQAASFHARAIFELSLPDNPEEGSRILFLFDIPDKPIEEQEALDVAHAILKKNPFDELALQTISTLKDYKKKQQPVLSGFSHRQELESLIVAGKLFQAKDELSFFKHMEWTDILIHLAYEDRNTCTYTFIWFLIQHEESAELHYLAYRIVICAFPIQLIGCDAVALFHIKRAMHLDPSNEKYREHFIMLHTPPLGPNKLISNDEVEAVIKKGGGNYRFYSFSRMVLKKIGKDI